MSHVERRRARRISVDIDSNVDCHRIKTVYEGQPCYFSATINDLSLNGCLLRTHAPLVVGARVEIELSLPTVNDPLLLHAMVMHVKTLNPRFGELAVGLHLTAPTSDSSRQPLRNYILHRLQCNDRREHYQRMIAGPGLYSFEISDQQQIINALDQACTQRATAYLILQQTQTCDCSAELVSLGSDGIKLNILEKKANTGCDAIVAGVRGGVLFQVGWRSKCFPLSVISRQDRYIHIEVPTQLFVREQLPNQRKKSLNEWVDFSDITNSQQHMRLQLVERSQSGFSFIADPVSFNYEVLSIIPSATIYNATGSLRTGSVEIRSMTPLAHQQIRVGVRWLTTAENRPSNTGSHWAVSLHELDSDQAGLPHYCPSTLLHLPGTDNPDRAATTWVTTKTFSMPQPAPIVMLLPDENGILDTALLAQYLLFNWIRQCRHLEVYQFVRSDDDAHSTAVTHACLQLQQKLKQSLQQDFPLIVLSIGPRWLPLIKQYTTASQSINPDLWIGISNSLATSTDTVFAQVDVKTDTLPLIWIAPESALNEKNKTSCLLNDKTPLHAVHQLSVAVSTDVLVNPTQSPVVCQMITRVIWERLYHTPLKVADPPMDQILTFQHELDEQLHDQH